MKTKMRNNVEHKLGKTKRTKKNGKSVSRKKKSIHRNSNRNSNSNRRMKGGKKNKNTKNGTCEEVECLENKDCKNEVNLSNQVSKFEEIELSVLFDDYLSKCETMTSLNISNNNLGKTGAFQVADFLKTNTSVINLDISNNKIGNEGAKNIAKVLTPTKTTELYNRTLISLNISNNDIGDEGMKAIYDALYNLNITLETINYTGNTFDDSIKNNIEELLRGNKSYKEKNKKPQLYTEQFF